MRRSSLLSMVCLALLLILTCGFFSVHSLRSRLFKYRLSQLPGVESVEYIAKGPFLIDRYLITLRQPLSYSDSAAGSFLQRIAIGYNGAERNTVMVTEGYSIQRYLNRPNRVNEMVTLLGMNEVLVEHRFFVPSAPIAEKDSLYPDSVQYDLNWDYLTTYNAASDHHRVFSVLSAVFSGKWVATGASKGGLTSFMYAAYYPEDMDLTIPYVAPFCITQEDPRMADFLLYTVGTAEQREQHNGLAMEALKRKDIFWERFLALCDSGKWAFQIPLDTVYQLAALDMPVGLWMYKPDTVDLPALDCPDDTLWMWLKDNLGPDGLSNEVMSIPYYVQAAKELGCYSYDLRPFADYLTLSQDSGLWQMTYLPQDWHFLLDTTMHSVVEKFLLTTTRPIIFIYGQNDPWTSVGVGGLWPEWSRDVVSFHAHDNLYLYTLPRGNHGAKIAAFSDGEYTELMNLIDFFLR